MEPLRSAGNCSVIQSSARLYAPACVLSVSCLPVFARVVSEPRANTGLDNDPTDLRRFFFFSRQYDLRPRHASKIREYLSRSLRIDSAERHGGVESPSTLAANPLSAIRAVLRHRT